LQSFEISFWRYASYITFITLAVPDEENAYVNLLADTGINFVGALGLKHPSEKCHGCIGAPIRLIIIVKRSLNQIITYQEGVMKAGY